MSTRHVTVGVDGSPQSVDAADWAAREAVRRGRPLRLLYAGPAAEGPASHLPELDAPAERTAAALHDLPRQLAYAHPSLEIRFDHLAGAPVPALLAAAAESTLLVLGSRGLSGLTGFLVGSVAAAVCAHTAGSVVLVRAGQRPEDDRTGPGSAPYRPVLLGLDLGHPSDDLLTHAFEAAAVRGAALQVLHAWTLPVLTDYAPGVVPLGDAPGLEADRLRTLHSTLQPWQHKFPETRVVERLEYGHPSHHLLKAATEAGLLVIGRRTAEGPHLGHVTHALIHRATCPVLVVPHA
ncbi:universal stress protein [Streptomyces sp. VRA16 Mangrove soil]|uniref:universal stress protein n=1 Tax=Streptomyces sp. VRA16 Mangrove soil TaxID=2817434 RepID=UPI001A9F0DA1|nr:universal stress protein [Streptomyces sp. VRA16 Mangrove soil]MBO1334421.1 universal stress protein [Streptomyces sp. VRA16 Mangrove soil]